MAKRGKINRVKAKDEDTRPFRPRRYDMFVLIVCEDQNTEPYYFRQFKEIFPAETVFLREIGTGKKPLGIVQQTLDEMEIFSVEARKTIDEVWVVFDKDDEDLNAKTIANFNEAWALAQKEKIKIAFSNEVFELWLLLHFSDVSSEIPIPRADIYSLLGKEISSFRAYESFVYDHKRPKPETIDAVFNLGNEDRAIERAEILLEKQKSKLPIEANPSTTVHTLVKKLRDLITWYSYSPDKL